MRRASSKTPTSRHLLRIAELGSVLLPLVVVLYFTILSVSKSMALVDTVLLLALGWLSLGLVLYRQAHHMQFLSPLWIGMYHLLLAWYLLFSTGFSEPLVFLWPMLMVASFVRFGLPGMIVSGLLLMATGTLDAIYVSSTSFSHAFTINTLHALIAFTLGVFASAFVRGSELDSVRKDKALQQTQLESDGLKTLINELTDPIMSLDFRGRVSLYNAAVLNLFDTNVSLAHKRIDDIISLQTADGKPLLLAKLFQSIRTVTVRDDIQAKIAGEIVRLEVTISPIKSHFTPSGERLPDGWIVIMRDITRNKSLEEERDEFISVVSHELRTPISIAEGAISNAQLILKSEKADHKTVDDTVNMAHDQIVFLASMVNDLSTLSRAERGVGDDGEDIDVDAMIHELYAEYEPEASKRGLALNLHMPSRIGTIHTSQLYLRELLQNFVINALKYTHKGSITIDVRKSRTGEVTFSISDTGIGISKSDQKRVFDKFFRAEDYRTRETNGTGLGLYVAAKLSRKLGTEIAVKSRLNHGSTFAITLPAAVSKTKSSTPTT